MSHTTLNINYDDFEKLLVNNSSLDQIQAYLNRFNPIEVMRMSNQEIRHSNILAWLLDPSETHGLGDRFLKSFLAKALQGEYVKGGLSSIDIIQADLRDIEIKREWNNIDILILSTKNNFAIVLENKFKSKQHNGQLKKYIDKIEYIYRDDFPNIKIKGIFLTLYDEQPEDLSYATIGYDSICEILPRIIDIENSSISYQVKIFIEHYIETIKEAAGMSEKAKEMEKLAKSIYRQHHKIFDFIWQHGTSNEFNLALDELMGENWEDKNHLTIKNKIKISKFWSNSSLFCFLPTEWFNALGAEKYNWRGCEKWWLTYPVTCWIEINHDENTSGKLRLFAEVGPLSNYEDRLNLINLIKHVAENEKLHQISFQKNATDVGKKYSKFLKGNTIKIDDVQDIDEISNKMLKLFENFDNCFKKLTSALLDFNENNSSSLLK